HELERLKGQLQPQYWTRSAAQVYRRIAGASYSYRLSRRRLRKLIRQAADNGKLRSLVVCPAHSLLLGMLDGIPGIPMHLTAESIADGAFRMRPQAGRNFDLCLVELADLEAPSAKELLGAIAGQLNEPGTLLVYWHDQGIIPLRSIHNQIVQFALDRACNANAHYTGSWASVCAGKALHLVRNTPPWRRLLPLTSLPVL